MTQDKDLDISDSNKPDQDGIQHEQSIRGDIAEENRWKLADMSSLVLHQCPCILSLVHKVMVRTGLCTVVLLAEVVEELKRN